MTNRRVALIASVSGVMGIIAGAVAASWFWLNFNAAFMSSALLVRHEADIVTKVAVLEHLRAGHIEDATRWLETLLDGDLISAAAFAREGSKISVNARRAVEMERRARVASGYQPTDPTVRAAVEDALRLLPEAAVRDSAQPSAAEDAR